MITIEEKLKLFTKIVYDKVDKENQRVVENFNKEYGNIVEQKRQEFINEANILTQQSKKHIEKEKLHIISKARIEEKRIILEKKNEIFEEAIKELIRYAEGFTGTEEYKEVFFRDFRNVVPELGECSNVDVCVTQRDLSRFKTEILSVLSGREVNFICEDEITGGFIIWNNNRNIKIDMSFSNRILNSKEYLGARLSEIF